MNNQKNTLWLVKFELKHSVKNLLLLLPILFILVILIRSLVPNYLQEGTMGLDLIMFITLTYFSQITRPKDFQTQKLNGLFYASPFLIALNQLGVPKDVIVKYRFLSYLIINSLFVVLLFIGLYPVFQEVLSIPSYLVFGFLWYCISIYIGCMTPAYEAASNLAISILIGLILGFVMFFIGLFVFYLWYRGGFVSWTIYVSTEYPVWTVAISFFFAISGWLLWMKRMKQKMSGADYL